VDLGGVTQVEPQTLADLCARYELEMDPDSVPGLVERFQLRFSRRADLARDGATRCRSKAACIALVGAPSALMLG